MLNNILRTSVSAFFLTVVLGGCTTDGIASGWQGSSSPASAPPSLVVTNEPAPDVIYHRGSRDTVLPEDNAISAPRLDNGGHVETLVTRKVAELEGDLSQDQTAVGGFQSRLAALQAKSDALAAEYYSLVASINTELQSGTTAGNPILTERWNQAQSKLDGLSQSAGDLNALSADISAEASKASYLQESVRATYGLSGAVAEDHKNLQKLEDNVNQSIVQINRLLTSVNDEISRRTAYLRAEHLNLQTLSLAVANGELYGQNMANSLYKKAADDGQAMFRGASPAQRRPLVVIRFDRPNVNYQQALYMAVSQALEKFPAAKFDLIAVNAAQGNPAQLALASTEARKNGEGVLRALTRMGLPMERIRLNAASSSTVPNSEVRIYIQ